MSAESSRPVRPSIPPLAWFAAAVWAGVTGGEAYAWDGCVRLALPTVVGAAALVLMIVALGHLVRFRARTSLVVIACGVVAGWSLGVVYWSGLHAACSRPVRTSVHDFEVVLVQDPVEGTFGPVSAAIVLSGELAGRKVVVRWGDEDPAEVGARVCVEGAFRASGDDEWGRRSRRAGQVGSLAVDRVEPMGWAAGVRGVTGRLRERAGTVFDRFRSSGVGLLRAVVLADQRHLPASVEDSFRVAGLTHLIAVSGGHLVVVAAFIEWSLSLIRVPARRAWPLVGLVTLFYVVLTGVQPSAVRSWVMSLVPGISRSLRRRPDGLASLSVAVVGTLAWSPAMAFDLGFRLSVASVCGLVVFARLAAEWFGAVLPRVTRWAAEPLALACVAQVATIPVACPVFGVVSLVSPFANVLAGPAIGFALVSGLVGLIATTIIPAVGGVIVSVAAVACSYAVATASWFAGMPNACLYIEPRAPTLWVGTTASAVTCWVRWPKPSRTPIVLIGLGLTVVLAVMTVPAPFSRTPELVALDVGQGDALLVLSEGEVALIDTGPTPDALRRALTSARVRRIDRVILTHAHEDHIGGVGALTRHLKVREICVPPGMEMDACVQATASRLHATVTSLAQGDRVMVGGIALDVLWPSRVSAGGPVAVPDENESGIVAMVSAEGRSALLTADAEDDVIGRLVTQGCIGDIDLLKVGHHGSGASVSVETLRVLRPEEALISVGAGNRYRHPHRETVDKLVRAGCSVSRTDEDGTLTYQFATGTVTGVLR